MDPVQYLALKRLIKWVAGNPHHSLPTIPFDSALVYMAEERGWIEFTKPAFGQYAIYGWCVTDAGRALLRAGLR